ncbi:sigma-70 family RNA polymerase sigma factor [candidate division KSB1 bacterium]|nr:sigma-70 family RNA polymerase sigma factor [candidate division KSB1 bacterium]
MSKCKDAPINFLQLLKTEQSEGWQLFLKQYTETILRAIRRFSFDYDESMEIYIYVCEKLAENNCARLKQFRGEGHKGQCTFPTWLITTVINFCRAWIRLKKGRRRLFEAVKNLSKFDQTVFELYYWQNYNESEINELLNTKSATQITPLKIHHSLQQINQVLTQKNKWKIVSALLRRIPTLSLEQLYDEHGEKLEIKEDNPAISGPDELLEQTYRQNLLHQAFNNLTAEEQQLLRLRFERDLSGREIGEVLNINKHKVIYQKLATIIEKIRNYLDTHEFDAVNDENFQRSIQIFSEN